MDKNLFVWLGVLFILLSPVRSLRAEPPYKFVTEMTCGDTNLFAFTYCTTDEQSPLCYQQHFVFENGKTGYVTSVNASGEPNYRRNRKTGKMFFDSLESIAYEWACVKGNNGHYVIVYSGTGGNCSDCEWYEIYGLNGKLYTLDPRVKRKQFDKIYKKLGLPDKWPSGSFEDIEHRSGSSN